MENLEPRFTTEEVANRYGVKITTVQRWVREGAFDRSKLRRKSVWALCISSLRPRGI